MLLFALFPIQKDEGYRVTVSGTIFCQEGGKGNIPLGGASISLVAGKDTLNTVSDKSGRFSFSFPQSFEVTILARYQGFEDFRETYQLFENHTAVAIQMKQSHQQLDAAKVEAEIPFITRDADTVIINMAPLEKMDGDKAIDMLLQIPGFAINSLGRLTVWGEMVDKTYVNGKLIYGDNPMSALALLKAEEIKNVRVYDTQRLEDKHRGVKNSKKSRVIDVRTFKQFFSAVDIQAQARIGALDKKDDMVSGTPLRYSAGFDFDSNQEMQQISVNVNGNNIRDYEKGLEAVKNAASALSFDDKHFGAGFKYVKKWKDAEWGNSFSAGYTYLQDDARWREETKTDRIGTVGGLVPLHYENDCLWWSGGGFHQATIGAELHQSPLKDISFDLRFVFDDDYYGQSERISSETDDAGIQRQDQKSGQVGRSHGVLSIITWSNPYAKNGWTPQVRLSYYLSNYQSDSYRIDTLKSSSTRRYLEGNGGGKNHEFNGEFVMKKILSDKGLLTSELELIGSADYDNEHKRVMTVDHLLPEYDRTDYANSFDYSWNDLKFSTGVGLVLSSPMARLLSIRAGLVFDKQLDTEVFPEDVRASNSFTMPFAEVYITPPLRKDRLYLHYSLTGRTPALEQVRERVDNSNPLRLQVGNPDLEASLGHRVSISYYPRLSSKGSSVSFESEFTFNQNPIVDRIRFYSQSGSFKAWGVEYDIPAGGTLTGYENADLAFDMYCRASYSCRIKPLKGNLESAIRFNIYQTPEFDDDLLNHVTGLGPEVDLSLSTTPVKFLRLKLSSKTSYTKDINAFKTVMSELILEKCSVSAEMRFGKHAFCNASYNADIYSYLSGMGVNTDVQNLSFALGCFFLDGKLAVGISGSDLLGKAVDFSTSVTASEFSRLSQPSLGRFCLLNVAYRLANRK